MLVAEPTRSYKTSLFLGTLACRGDWGDLICFFLSSLYPRDYTKNETLLHDWIENIIISGCYQYSCDTTKNMKMTSVEGDLIPFF